MKIVLINIFLVLGLYANDLDFKSLEKSNILTNQIKYTFPKVASNLENILTEVDNSSCSTDAIYYFISSSVPIQSIKTFIQQASILNFNFGTKVLLVFQGFTDLSFEQKLVELREELQTYQAEHIFLKNFTRVIDPNIFTDLNITKVPILGYGKYQNDPYPSDANIKYIVRGDIKVEEFISLISTKEVYYEAYLHSIVNTK